MVEIFYDLHQSPTPKKVSILSTAEVNLFLILAHSLEEAQRQVCTLFLSLDLTTLLHYSILLYLLLLVFLRDIYCFAHLGVGFTTMLHNEWNG